MRIPNQRLTQSMASAYGAGALELIPGYEEPGCPRLYREKYVQGTDVPEPFAWQRHYGSTVHAALELLEAGAVTPEEALISVWDPALGPDRFLEAVKDLDSLLGRGDTGVHTVAVEQDLEIDLYEDEDYGKVKIGGRIDRIGTDLVLPNRLYFDDYKTDRRPPSYANLDRWIQGQWYAALVRGNAKKFLPAGQVKRVEVVGRYEAVKWYGLDKTFTNQQLDAFLSWAESLARRILRDDTAKPRLNPACGWCPIRGDCPEWARLAGVGDGLLERLVDVPLEKRGLALEKLGKVRRDIERAEDDIKAAIIEKIRLTKAPFVVKKTEFYLKPTEKRFAQAEEIYTIMGEEFWPLVSISMERLDEWVARNPDKKQEVELWVRKAPGNDQLKDRPVPSS